MPEIRSAGEIARKYARVTPGRAKDYEEGVRSPRKDFATNAAAAEGSYEAGIQAAIADGRFGKGVRRAGTEKWQRKTIEKGVARYGPGVAAAEADYAAGMEAVVRVIQGVTLPPRGPKGSPQNIERVRVIAEALHNMKIAGARGG